MKLLKFSRSGIFFTVLSMLPSVATALPITFDFTGTISNSVLSNGSYIKIDQSTQWLGKTVNGSFTLDIDNVETNPQQSSYQKYYDSSYGSNSTDWLSVAIVNPDGRSYSYPPEDQPLSVDVDSAVASLIYRDSAFPDVRFYVGRTFSNLNTTPKFEISLRLTAWGPKSLQMLNGLDFDTLNVNPTYADRENYGIAEYDDGAGENFNYYFTIDSISRRDVNAHVNEPSLLLLAVFALGFITWVRWRKYSA